MAHYGYHTLFHSSTSRQHPNRKNQITPTVSYPYHTYDKLQASAIMFTVIFLAHNTGN